MLPVQGEVLSLRINPDMDPLLHRSHQLGVLWFDDGSMKGLACYINLVGLVLLDQQGLFREEDLRHPRVQSLIQSMLQIATIYKSDSATASVLDGQIARVVKQNQDAQAQQISSFGWACLLRQLAETGEEILFDQCMMLYNAHPAVQQMGDTDGSGAGSVKIDNKKSSAIRNWLERTSEATTQLVSATQHDTPFSAGPFGETLSLMPFLFLGSVSPIGLSANPTCGLEGLEGEHTVHLEWQLPLDEEAQYVLFRRIRSDFESATALVEVKAKKRYRAKEPDLQQLRNIMALWSQVKSLCSHQFDVGDFEEKLASGNHVDDELAEVLLHRPPRFAISMMPAQKRKMQEANQSRDAKVHCEVEQQRLEVRSARWDFFRKALSQDQSQLVLVQAAPAKIAAMQRRVEALWRQEQAALGEKAVNAWCNKFMRVVSVEKVEFVIGPINDFVTFIVAWRGKN